MASQFCTILKGFKYMGVVCIERERESVVANLKKVPRWEEETRVSENGVRFTEVQTACRRPESVVHYHSVLHPLSLLLCSPCSRSQKKQKNSKKKKRTRQWRETGGIKAKRREERGTARYEAEKQGLAVALLLRNNPFLFPVRGRKYPSRGARSRERLSLAGVALASRWTERVCLCPTQPCCGCWSIPQLPPPLLHTQSWPRGVVARDLQYHSLVGRAVLQGP